MEAVIFSGIQATGKTTFYAQRFLHTHVRISLDLMRTDHREATFLGTCLDTGQRFVVDRTNATRAERARYIGPARERSFSVVGYHFLSRPRDAIDRNERREGKQRVPIPGILGTHKRLEPPAPGEGYDELYTVTLEDERGFVVASAATAGSG